jgi:hypothetical protein
MFTEEEHLRGYFIGLTGMLLSFLTAIYSVLPRVRQARGKLFCVRIFLQAVRWVTMGLAYWFSYLAAREFVVFYILAWFNSAPSPEEVGSFLVSSRLGRYRVDFAASIGLYCAFSLVFLFAPLTAESNAAEDLSDTAASEASQEASAAVLTFDPPDVALVLGSKASEEAPTSNNAPAGVLAYSEPAPAAAQLPRGL